MIFKCKNLLLTIIITSVFCLLVLLFALVYGTRLESDWYLLIIAFPVLIIGGGIEEVGWRGFLQPQLEEKFSFPIATVFTSMIWYIWHLPLWLLPSSNHYGDSLIGFAITIFVFSFILAAIYKSTKSIFACVCFHAFFNTIGAIYDWNSLFDCYPKNIGMTICYIGVFIVSIIIWCVFDLKESKLKVNKIITD
jgi:membrane protease YdiL (CAAX protease family)